MKRRLWTCPNCGMRTIGFGVGSHKRRCKPPVAWPPGTIDDDLTVHDIFRRVSAVSMMRDSKAEEQFIISHPIRYIRSALGFTLLVVGEDGDNWLTPAGPYPKATAALNERASQLQPALMQALFGTKPAKKRQAKS